MDYKEAMQQLQGMFTDFDRETIKTILVANNGYLEKTIEDLLKLGNDSPGKSNGLFDDDNLFADTGNNGNRNRNTNQQSGGLYDDNTDGLANNFANLGLFQGGGLDDE